MGQTTLNLVRCECGEWVRRLGLRQLKESEWGRVATHDPNVDHWRLEQTTVATDTPGIRRGKQAKRNNTLRNMLAHKLPQTDDPDDYLHPMDQDNG